MPPMSSLRTFITALKTGDTRTTQALNKLVARKGAQTVQLRADLRKPGALAAPLQQTFRQALRGAGLTDTEVRECIDRWPDGQKEKVRKALVAAGRHGHRVRFTWGLTAAPACETTIDASPKGAVTITALSPRSRLRIYAGTHVNVAPVSLAAGRSTAKTV